MLRAAFRMVRSCVWHPLSSLVTLAFKVEMAGWWLMLQYLPYTTRWHNCSSMLPSNRVPKLWSHNLTLRNFRSHLVPSLCLQANGSFIHFQRLIIVMLLQYPHVLQREIKERTLLDTQRPGISYGSAPKSHSTQLHSHRLQNEGVD